MSDRGNKSIGNAMFCHYFVCWSFGTKTFSYLFNMSDESPQKGGLRPL